jgi:lysophospholipase L1-like esterase
VRFARLTLCLKASVVAAASVVAVILAACGDDPDADPAVTDATTGPEASLESSTADSAADAVADGPVADGSSRLSPTFVFRDINAILSTGQSLSIGSGGHPLLSVAQPYDNLRFPGGPRSTSTGLTSLVPLIEEGDETMSSGLANLVTKMAREEVLIGQPANERSHDILVSVHGVLGVGYSALKKGGATTAYANGIAQAQAGFTLAKAQGKSYVVRAVTNVHGESDHQAGITDYEADLVQWQSDYQTDIKAITGQPDPVPMFHTQFSSWTAYGSATSRIVLDQLAAHVDAPGKIILVGAKYHLPYQPDGIHLSNDGYRQMGEYYAKAYRRVILEGKPWEPLRPKAITRAGAVVTVKMHVPAPPLVIDTTLVSDPGHNGFEWADDGGGATPTITKVALTAADTVEITLSATPTAANKHLRYAFTGIPNAPAGATTGARGNLRDSDATESRGGYKLYNWAVHFDAPAP